jgi:hypothetical protein
VSHHEVLLKRAGETGIGYQLMSAQTSSRTEDFGRIFREGVGDASMQGCHGLISFYFARSCLKRLLTLRILDKFPGIWFAEQIPFDRCCGKKDLKPQPALEPPRNNKRGQRRSHGSLRRQSSRVVPTGSTFLLKLLTNILFPSNTHRSTFARRKRSRVLLPVPSPSRPL